MPIADLPYRIERLRHEGQYAYLAKPIVRVKSQVQLAEEDAAPKKAKKTTVQQTRLRVLRNVTLCDGPSLWVSIRSKGEDEAYAFYVSLRLFATPSMVASYLSGPEVLSYSEATGSARPELKADDLVINEHNYLDEVSVHLTRVEYSQMLKSRDSSLSIEKLEELVCQVQGVDSITALEKPKRGRRKKVVSAPVETIVEPPPKVSAVDDEEGVCESSVAEETKALKIKKKKSKATLRQQYSLVQNTPSRVIDVSGFGDTMQHQKGRILDRVKHAERIAKCTVLPDLFPIVSDNVPAFERAMQNLGTRFLGRIADFKTHFMSSNKPQAC